MLHSYSSFVSLCIYRFYLNIKASSVSLPYPLVAPPELEQREDYLHICPSAEEEGEGVIEVAIDHDVLVLGGLDQLLGCGLVTKLILPACSIVAVTYTGVHSIGLEAEDHHIAGDFWEAKQEAGGRRLEDA